MEKSNLSEMYSVASYTGDGALKGFSVPFPYLYREDVHVYFVSALDEEGEITREEKRLYPLIQNEYPPSVFDAYWVSDTVIKFVTAPPAGQTIEIKRITNRLVPEVEFSNSSILSEEDLNLITTQLLYIVQEAYDNQNILQSDFSEYVNETLTITVDYAKEAKEAREAVEALKTLVESYKEQASLSASQAKQSEINSENILAQTQQAKTEAVAAIQAQQSASESAVEQAGDAQAVRLEQLASNILVSGTAYNKEATVTLDQPITAGTVVSLPVADDGQQMMYRVGASTLRMGFNGTLLFEGEQFEEVGNTGSLSTSVKLLFDAEAGDVLNFFVYAQNVMVVVDEESGLSIDGQKRLSAAGIKAVADEAKEIADEAKEIADEAKEMADEAKEMAGEFVELLDGKLDKVTPVAEGPLTVSRIRFVNPAGKEMGYLYSDNSDLDEISLSLTGAQFSRLGEGSKPIQDIYTNHLYGGFVHANMSQSMFMFLKINEDVTFTLPNGGTWAVHMLAGSSYGDIGNHSRAETLAGGSSHNWGNYYRAYVWGYRVA